MKNREFWMQVFIASIRHGYSAANAIITADEAVHQLNQRTFPDES
jgi:hypothetical protein